MKNKIGILTYHDAFNYGAVLQNYALENVLQRLHPDKEVETINYKCVAVVPKSRFSDLVKARGVLNAIVHYPGRRKLAVTYERFRNQYLHLSKRFETHKELLDVIDDYSAIVSGSDQVWNTKFNGGDDIYVQSFHERNDIKYSYAVSLGSECFAEEEIPYYEEKLEKFQYISMREKTGKDAVEEQLGLEAVQHIDPTFLLTVDDWNSIAETSLSKKYILLYMVPYQKNVADYAKKCGRDMNLPVIVVTKSLKPYLMKHRDSSTPNGFLALVRGAEMVITNSFHGTAFSIIYHKKFALEMNNSRGFNYRSANLLDVLGICYDKETVGPQIFEGIDWIRVEKRIKKQREISIEYLKQIGDKDKMEIKR
jgi:hypothetical protein